MYARYIKRWLDFILSLLAITILSPILLIVAILVRIKLGAPVIFKQKRPGLHEKIFTLYKFRTMTDEKDKNGNLLPDDQRLTKFGKLLRSTSLDELPELFNILKGDMSIVGPRPLLVKYLPYYTEEERHRHDVRPGLTGLAQVSGRNFLNWEDRFKIDCKYASKVAFFKDVSIVLKTILKVFKKENIMISTNELTFDDLDKVRREKDIHYEVKKANYEFYEEYYTQLYSLLLMSAQINLSNINNVQEFVNQRLNLLKNSLKNKTAIVFYIKVGDCLCGFIWAYLKDDMAKEVHITDIVVDKKYQNQRYGTKLIETLYIYSKNLNYKYMSLLVTSDNINAVKFYEKKDFYEFRKVMRKDILQ